jgi:hypothetical protein
MEKSLKEKINNFELKLNNFKKNIEEIKENENKNNDFISKSKKDLENLKKLQNFIQKIFLLCNSNKSLENKIKLEKNKKKKEEETKIENKKKNNLITIVKNIKELIKKSNKINDIEKNNIKKILNNLEINNNLISERLRIIRYIDTLILHTDNKNDLRDLINLKLKIMEPSENNKIKTLNEIKGITITHLPKKKGINTKYNNYREKLININKKIKTIKKNKIKTPLEFQKKLTELKKTSNPKKKNKEEKILEFQKKLTELRKTRK